MLTEGQVAHFKTFGFLVLRQLFTPDEMAIIKRESDEIFEESRGGAPFAGEERQAEQPFFERRPFMSMLPDDDRIYDIGTDLCGPDFVLDGSEGNLHVGDTAWHGGNPEGLIKTESGSRSYTGYGEFSLPNVKITFYPEPATMDSGCLRVIPGSHKTIAPDLFAPLRTNNKDPDFRPFGVRPSEIPCYCFESQPGDVIVFTENVLHAAFGGKTGRHQHAISFFANPRTEDEVELVRRMCERGKYSFHPSTSYIDSDRPRLRRMVSKLVEWGFEPIEA